MNTSTKKSRQLIKALTLAIAGTISISTARAQIYTVNTGNANVFEYPSSGGATSTSPFITLPGSGSSLAYYDGNLLVAQNDNEDNNVIEYNASTGAKVTGFDITGLSDPLNLAVSGNSLYVLSAGDFGGSSGNDNGTLGVYNAATGVGTTLLTGLNESRGMAVANGNIYVGSFGTNTISEYNSAGILNASFSITGLNDPANIVVANGDLFVTNIGNGTVGEYDATTGATINTDLITLNKADGLALTPSGDLLVSSYSGGAPVAEYDLNGNLVNANYITGSDFTGALIDAPEPTTWTVILSCIAGASLVSRLRRLV